MRPDIEPLHFKRLDELKVSLSHEFLVDGILKPRSKVLIIGDTNVGKSLIAQSLAMHLASGKDWHGRKVKRCLCLYLAAEDGDSIPDRMEALRLHMALNESPIMGVLNQQIDLLDAESGLEPLIAGAKAFGEASGQKPDVIFVDTFAAAFSGDENSAKDMNRYNRSIERLRSETEAAIVAIHHTGKSPERGARGHSSHRAAIDTEISVTDGVFKITKQRNGKRGEVFGFKIEEVVVGIAQDGSGIRSAVAVPKEYVGVPKELKLSKTNYQALQILRRLYEQNSKCPVFVRDWKAEFVSTLYHDGKKETADKAFCRAFGDLIVNGRIKKDHEGNKVWIP